MELNQRKIVKRSPYHMHAIGMLMGNNVCLYQSPSHGCNQYLPKSFWPKRKLWQETNTNYTESD